MSQIVFKNDGSIPVDNILCTTYQMRNFYRQLNDGFFTDLDVMNYIQHLAVVRMMKKNDVVLDVCCGRGLLLPLIRYHSKEIKKYIGVDIELKNIESKTKNICNGKTIDPKIHFPFETEWIISNVADMASKIKNKIDLIIYTSAIEHMHKTHGEQSLAECSKVIKKNGLMFLSCPNTPENRNGFDVQYKAHVYEWKISELRSTLLKNGFKINKMLGLTGSINEFKKIMDKFPRPIKEYFEVMIEYIPNEFLKPYLYLTLPKLSKEVLLICEKI